MTQTLPKFPLRRLSLLRRVPFWAQAAAVCALFAIAGLAILDDYGVPFDENFHRNTVITVANYTLGVSEEPPYGHDRYYGVAFEMPLFLLERALGLQDTRHIYLTRHLIMHLFFIAGGFVCGMLAYRMLGNRWIALLAMLMFLLHPRLYAHSFFNVKDIPFAVMLLVALYLARRAFRQNTLGAFLLCGIGVGLAINMRVFGLMLPPLILAARALDLWQAGRAERNHILASAGIFAGAALAIVYIIHPYYWENPLRFVEGIRALSQHPNILENLFMGEIYKSDAVPWNYIPVWFAITAPPLTLLLGAVGCATLCWQAITRPLHALRDREIRFRVLLLGCFVMPVAVAIALQSNIYTGWRHMYFLWAPFSLLAAVGLRAIANNNVGKGRLKVVARLSGWVRGGALRRTLAYGMAGVGLITTLTAMTTLHPYEHVYFNALTDTKTPGALGERYSMDYWRLAYRQSLERLLARYPDDTLRVWQVSQNRLILPQNDRERIIRLRSPRAADFYLFGDAGENRLIRKSMQDPRFYLHPRVNLMSALEQPPLYAIHAYGSAIAYILAPQNAMAYRAAYDDVAANGTPLAHSDFDIYAYDGALYYLNANCAPLAPNVADMRVFLHIIPSDPSDLPTDRREHGFENLDFRLDTQASFFDGKCIHRQPLPDYPIARIATGQKASAPGGDEWRADIDLAAYAAAQAVYDSVVAGDYGQPVAQSGFDVYQSGNSLAYLKEPCAAGDADARFFLHIFLVDPADLPADSRELGFANLDFQFADHGADIGGKCVAERELSDYAIERIRTGQFLIGEGRLWGAEFPVSR